MNVPQVLKALKSHLNVDQAGLAKRLGVGQPQISRWEKGKEPKRASYERIYALAQSYGVIAARGAGMVASEDVVALLPPKPRPKTVRVKGYVGASAEAHEYCVDSDGFEEIDAPAYATDTTCAFEVKGNGLGPLLNRWLLLFDDARSPVTPDLIGKLCVSRLSDGRLVVKQIQSNGRGGYKLVSNTSGNDIDDAQIEWAAKVIDMRPR